jgi:hypothetical protein
MEVNLIESLLKAANSSTENDTSVNGAKRSFLTDVEAREFFDATRRRMVRIEEWRKASTVTSYDLFDASGRDANSEPISAGKFIRINLYGSGKYDWVSVEKIFDEPGEFVIKVRPDHDPTDPDDRDSTSHFFGPEARNNFCLQLIDRTVAFYVIGLDEKQNTRFTDSLIESARNAAIANVGYYSGLQKTVWKEFCTKMLEIDEEGSD